MLWIAFLVALFFFIQNLKRNQHRKNRRRNSDYFKRKF
jgi:hypothetical protein